MSDTDRVQYKLMLPADLKQRLEHAAVDSRRSLSAEIILRLEASIDEMPEVLSDHLENRAQKLQLEIRAQRAEAHAIEERIEILRHKLIEIVTKIQEREDKEKRPAD